MADLWAGEGVMVERLHKGKRPGRWLGDCRFCEGRGLSQAPLRLGRRCAQGFRLEAGEKKTASKIKEGVHVPGVVK